MTKPAGSVMLRRVMGPFEPLARSFYEPSAKVVAPRLLGHWLVRRTAQGVCGGAIVETEAYLRDDPACHAARGLTPRNRVMFGEPGHGYVYFIYGCHFCVNAVCCPLGTAEAVLIRALEPGFGLAGVHGRGAKGAAPALTDGPGKLCRAMGIDRQLDGVDLCDPNSPLMIALNPQVERFREECGPVVVTRRIGIRKAARLRLRFYLKECL